MSNQAEKVGRGKWVTCKDGCAHWSFEKDCVCKCHTMSNDTECGFMIMTPTPIHDGGRWCAEKYPCKLHGDWRKTTSSNDTEIEWEKELLSFAQKYNLGVAVTDLLFDFITSLLAKAKEEAYKEGRDASGTAWADGYKEGAEEARSQTIKECLAILEDEITLAHTTKAGKTSRLTSAYNRIKSLQALALDKKEIQ